MGSISIAIGCSQEVVERNDDIIPILGENVFVSKGILNFKKLDDYANLIGNPDNPDRERVIATLDQLAGYKSLKSVYQSRQKSGQAARSAEEIEEDELADSNEFISTLINDEGLIRIDDYYFNIDVYAQQVLALNTDYSSDLGDLASLQYQTNPNILVYSTSDDVIDILFPTNNIARSSNNGRSELFCRDSGAPRNVDIRDFNIATRFRQSNRVVYQKLGIYFSLLAKTKTQYRSDIGFWVSNADCGQYIQYYYEFKPKCRNAQFGSGTKSDDGCDNTLKYRPYEKASEA